VYQQQQQQEEQEQDAENPFLDPPFSRIKTRQVNNRASATLFCPAVPVKLANYLRLAR
jgi:hypothetical protein